MTSRAIVLSSAARQWNAFYKQWAGCAKCDLARQRENLVFFRGTVPAKILFVGEAPGESEDQQGYPFVGPAGEYLDGLLEAAGVEVEDSCLTNTVCCISRDANMDLCPPPKEAIKLCSLRLKSFANIVNPDLIVLVGKVAASASLPLVGICPIVSVKHPSYIMQCKPNALNRERQGFIVSLRDGLERYGIYAPS